MPRVSGRVLGLCWVFACTRALEGMFDGLNKASWVRYGTLLP